MFNIGFTELLILGVIGLLVVGPEQLPGLARKISRMLNELKRAKDEIMAPLDEMKSETHQALLKLRQELEKQEQKVNATVNKIENKIIEPIQTDQNNIKGEVSGEGAHPSVTVPTDDAKKS